MTYDKESYLKYKEKLHKDPIRLEKYLNRCREIGRTRLKDPKYIEYNRKKSNEYYHKNINNPEFKKKVLLKARQRDAKVKLICITHYSNDTMKCACCEEVIYEFLSLNHINGDGGKHRKQLNGDSIWDWLIRNNFPKGYNILCMNCNWGSRLIGKCPHKEKKHA